MGRRPRKRVALVLWALVGSSATEADGQGGIVGARAQRTAETLGRWAHASALLSPVDDPTLLVASGKTAVAGQTVDSTPSTITSLSLNLSNPITDLSAPPWSAVDGDGPIASYAALVPLSSSSALFLGGDASSDPTVAVQTGNDSSWLLSLAPVPSSSAATAALATTWTHETGALWSGQPQRRENAYTASATNGTLSRAWIYGGQRPDGSGSTSAELWELDVVVERGGPVGAPRWAAWSGAGAAKAPPPMYDGKAVLVPSNADGAMPSVYLIGGVQIDAGTAALADPASVWAFTPNDALGGGVWAPLETTGPAPQGRRGHVAVEIGGGKIWIQGGRSLDGSTVLSDAWVLDTTKKRWSKTKAGEQVWGHSAAMVGETVVLAFGYGANAPASTSLSVYAPGNDTWLSAYYPSFATVVSNPKASGSSSHSWPASSAPPSSQDPYVSAGSAGSAGDATATGATSSGEPTGAGGSTDSSSNAPSSPAWTAPGAAGPSSPSSDPSGGSAGGSSSDTGSGAPSKSTIAGAIVGSLLGALVVVVGAGFALRRYREQNSPYAAAGLTGDDEFGRPGPGAGAGSLMAEHRLNGGYANSEAYNIGKTLTGLAPAGGVAVGGGVFGALAGLLGPRERYASAGAGRKRRFDMLRDEENDEAWDAGAGKEGWTRFDDERDGDGDAGSALGGVGRGGMGIWEGFGGISSGVDRLSDSIKSSRSYLGGALGGFIGAASKPTSQRRVNDQADDNDPFDDAAAEKHAPTSHVYAVLSRPVPPVFADPALTPIAEYEEDDTRSEPDESRTLESASAYTHSSGTHATGSTCPTSCEISPSKAAAARIGRPFSPASSLYGSGFGSQQLYAAGSGLARTSSGQSQASNRFITRSNSSWWSRLNLPKPSHADVSTPTAAAAIRDPAPAPALAQIAANDPFVDQPAPAAVKLDAVAATASAPPSRQPSYRVSRPDEHGRFRDSGHLVRGEHDASVTSNTSEATATSSVLEDRLRNMDVVQRIRTGSGGDSSVEVTPTLGATSDGSFGRLPGAGDDPFADAPTRPQLAYTPAQDPLVWAGSLAGALSEVGGARPSTPPPVPALPAILPPTPTYAPPDSPRKRLVGPRPQPLSPSGKAFGVPTRSSSVKDLVASIEQRGSLPVPGTAAARKRPKVEHGFAKKPLLYVANPDE